jgi:hypothetical protein
MGGSGIGRAVVRRYRWGRGHIARRERTSSAHPPLYPHPASLFFTLTISSLCSSALRTLLPIPPPMACRKDRLNLNRQRSKPRAPQHLGIPFRRSPSALRSCLHSQAHLPFCPSFCRCHHPPSQYRLNLHPQRSKLLPTPPSSFSQTLTISSLCPSASSSSSARSPTPPPKQQRVKSIQVQPLKPHLPHFPSIHYPCPPPRYSPSPLRPRLHR